MHRHSHDAVAGTSSLEHGGGRRFAGPRQLNTVCAYLGSSTCQPRRRLLGGWAVDVCSPSLLGRYRCNKARAPPKRLDLRACGPIKSIARLHRRNSRYPAGQSVSCQSGLAPPTQAPSHSSRSEPSSRPAHRFLPNCLLFIALLAVACGQATARGCSKIFYCQVSLHRR